jgi:ligand-binding sensor domain-containing protein/signal transduction histidine kinase
MAAFFFVPVTFPPGQSQSSIMPTNRWTTCPARLLLGVFVSAIGLLMAGAAEPSDSPFIVNSWSNEEGLPQSSAISVIQTKDGYLWLGTLNGLVRFDGNSFTSFNVNNTPGLPGNVIVFLFEDSRTNLWAGTDAAGLCLISNGVVKNFETGAGGKIIYAYEDETGAVWFCAADGRIFCWKNERLELQPSVSPVFWKQLFRRAFHVVVPRTDGGFWHLQKGRVEKWNGDKREKDFGACPWTPLNVAVVLSSSSFTFDANVTAACEDGHGNLVVGTHGDGVFWADGSGGWRHITPDEKSSQNFVQSLCFDHEGNLWVGTDGGGLYRVKKNYFKTAAGLPDGVAKSAAEDASGGLWVAFNAHGLSYLLTNSVKSFGIGQGSNAWSVLVDGRQQVWAGTRGEGLFHFESGGFNPVTEATNIGWQIFALFESRDGKLWAGGENGLGSFDGQDWKIFSGGDGLPKSAVRALADDARGNIWIGTEGGGLFSLRDGKVSAVAAPVKDISCLLVDRDNALWVGTSEHGLARFFQGDWTRYASTSGLTIDDIGYFIKDDADNLWIGSYEGLIRVAFTNGTAGAPKIISSRTFLTRECSVGAQPAAIRTRDGQMWFPTIEGLIAVNPAELKPNRQALPVVIESALIDDVEQKTDRLGSIWTGAVTLTPDNEQLDIHFTSLNFSSPKRAGIGVRFKYRLEGRDKNWTDAGTEHVAHFTKLAPGKYIFRVIACNEDGFWNETGATLAITVEPPFWRKPWFIGISVLVFLGTLGGIIYLISTVKLKRQLRVAQQKELIEKERARIARDLHDQLGANLTQVALLGEMAEADKNLPDEIELHAQQISQTARITTHALDEIVWAVNPSNDTLEGLANYACKYAQEYLALAGLRYRADVPANLPASDIPPEVRHHVFLAFKESVNNVVKHAQASEVWIRLRLSPGGFILEIEDNGRGLGNSPASQNRNGLRNMRKRMEDIGGEFTIAPVANGGTIVRLTVPII